MPIGDGQTYSAQGAINSSLRSQFGDGAFVNGKYNAQAAIESALKKQFGDEVYVNGRYSPQKAIEISLRRQFGDEAFPDDGPGPGGPPPPQIPDVAPPLDEETFFERGFNHDPGEFGPNFNTFDGGPNGGGVRPGPFGPNFNRPNQNNVPGTITDPNEGRGYRIPGFGNPNPGPQSAGTRSFTASAPLPGSTPQRNLFRNAPPSGSDSRINKGSNKLRSFLGAA